MKFRGGMSELMRQASRLQRKVAVRKEELKTATVEAGAGNDRVKVVVNGGRELVSLTIDPALLKEEDLGMVQDLIVAAVNAGMVKSNEMVEAEIEKVTGGVQKSQVWFDLIDGVRGMADDAIAQLIELLSRLPGIGERSAARLTYHVLGTSSEYARALGESLAQLHGRVRRCDRCRNYTERELCRQCSDSTRDAGVICVVARPQDAAAIERSAMFRGRYYVLHALLSPLDGVGPDALELEPLFARIRDDGVREVILATPLSVEGEATALYLAQELRPSGVRCTRIASGLPHGGELEYTDQVTITRALDGRREL